MAFEQGGTFFVPQLTWLRTSGFSVSSEGTPTLYPCSRFLRQSKCTGVVHLHESPWDDETNYVIIDFEPLNCEKWLPLAVKVCKSRPGGYWARRGFIVPHLLWSMRPRVSFFHPVVYLRAMVLRTSSWVM